jgi:DNA repair protein RadA/Sms
MFGELGLTGRLRPVAQSDRRLEECAKLGIATVVAPDGTSSHGGPRVLGVGTLGDALEAVIGPRARRPAASRADPDRELEP